jgi:hypothetical protein
MDKSESIWTVRSAETTPLRQALATILVYLNAALMRTAMQVDKILLLVLLMGSAKFLIIANEQTEALHMHNCVLQAQTEHKAYVR